MGVQSKVKLTAANPLFEGDESTASYNNVRRLNVPQLANKFSFMGMFSSSSTTEHREPKATGKFKGTLKRRDRRNKPKRGSSLLSVVSNLEQFGRRGSSSSVNSLLKLRNKVPSTGSVPSVAGVPPAGAYAPANSAPKAASSKKQIDRNAPPTPAQLEQNDMCRKAARMVRSLLEESEKHALLEPIDSENSNHDSDDEFEIPPNMDGDEEFGASLHSSEPLLSCCKGRKIPSIEIEAYLIRLVKYTNIWMEEEHSIESTGIRTLAVALVYIDRIIAQHSFVLTMEHVHRLLMGSFLLAIKMFEDQPISNRFWSQVGGVELADVNVIEGKICEAMKFSLNVDVVELEAYLEGIDRVRI